MYCNYAHLISINNLCQAWREFVRGKKYKPDVMAFSLNLSSNIFDLHEDLRDKTYCHGGYVAFSINDPKPRDIHKATVRDRLLHHAIYRILYPYFDNQFVYHSYSCRNFKGTHRALERLRQFSRQVSRNSRHQCWVLKCDVRQFFASIDHATLLDVLARHITDSDVINLLREVVGSFYSTRPGLGLPLGNLTSQLLVNIFLNEFDQFVKHELKLKHYLRYADDFVILHYDKEFLQPVLFRLQEFLQTKLKLSLHPDKISIKTIFSGVDFLGWVHFHDHRVLRTTTRIRMFKKLKLREGERDVAQSYLGLLGHGNAFKLQQLVRMTGIDK